MFHAICGVDYAAMPQAPRITVDWRPISTVQCRPDRLRLMVFPLILGAVGREPILANYPRTSLELIDSRVLDSRLVPFEYRPINANPPTVTLASTPRLLATASTMGLSPDYVPVFRWESGSQ